MAAAERTAGDGYTVSEVCRVPSARLSARGLSQVVAEGPSLCQSTGPLDGKVSAEECQAGWELPVTFYLLACIFWGGAEGRSIALLSLFESQESKVQYHITYGYG